MRAALYVRVSSEEQKLGMSIGTQVDALEQFCKNNGYTVSGLYNDEGFSARKKYTSRPALMRLLEDCKSKKFDIVLCTRLDRWSRSVSDFYKVKDILVENKVEWKTIWEQHDSTTANGVFFTNMVLSVSQSEADRTSERIKSVNKFRRSKGEWVGGVPCGYRISKSHLYIDEEKRYAVRTAFEVYMSTRNIASMLDSLRSNGVNVTRKTCVKMLGNPIYTGNALNHTCEAYLTQEEFKNINQNRNIGRTRLPKRKNTHFLFQGMVRCGECGGMYYSKTRISHYKDKTYRDRCYFCGRHFEHLCDNNVNYSENKLEQFCLSTIEQAMDEYISSVSNVSPVDKVDVEKERSNIENQIRRIGDRYEMDEISREEYMSKVRDLRAKLDDLVIEEPHTIKRLPVGWREIYDSLTPANKKSFWSQTIRYITIDKNRSVTLHF